MHSEYISVRAGSHESGSKNIIFDQINQQPVLLDTESMESTCEPVVTAFYIQLPSLTQSVDYGIRKRKVKASLLHEFIALLVCRSKFDLVHLVLRQRLLQVIHIAVTLRGRISLEMRLASSVASSVLWL